jgi:DNA-binding NtrC family response regulator
MLRQQNRIKLGSVSGESLQRMSIVVFSRDESIVKLIAEGMGDSWLMQTFADPNEARASLLKPGVRIVVIDDEAIDESTRGWLLDQVRKWAPQALVVYIAATHSDQTERRTRTYRVQYYTSKPIDRERTLRVLHSFERAAH